MLGPIDDLQTFLEEAYTEDQLPLPIPQFDILSAFEKESIVLPTPEAMPPQINGAQYQANLLQDCYQNLILPLVSNEQREQFAVRLRQSRGHWILELNAEQSTALFSKLIAHINAVNNLLSRDEIQQYLLSPFCNFLDVYKICIPDELLSQQLVSLRQSSLPITDVFTNEIQTQTEKNWTYQKSLQHAPLCPQLGAVIQNLLALVQNARQEQTPRVPHPRLEVLLAPADEQNELVEKCIQTIENFVTQFHSIHRKNISLTNRFAEIAERAKTYPGVFCTPLLKQEIIALLNQLNPMLFRIDPNNQQAWAQLKKGFDKSLRTYLCLIHDAQDKLSADGFAGEPHYERFQELCDTVSSVLSDNKDQVVKDSSQNFAEYSEELYRIIYLTRLRVMHSSEPVSTATRKSKVCLLFSKDTDSTQCQIALAVTCTRVGLVGIFPIAEDKENLRYYRRALHPGLRRYLRVESNQVVTVDIDHDELTSLKDHIVENDKEYDDHVCIKIDTSVSILKRSTEPMLRASRAALYSAARTGKKRRSEIFDFKELIKTFRSAPPALYTDELSLRLYPYQLNAVQQIVMAMQSNNRGTLLADDMGMGKTIQAGAVIKYNGKYPVIIISPLSVLTKWPEELAEKIGIPAESIICYHGQNRLDQNIRAGVLVTTYDTFINDCQNDTPLARSLGFMQPFDFTDCHHDVTKRMVSTWQGFSKLTTQADDTWVSSDGRIKDLPNQQVLARLDRKVAGPLRGQLAKLFASLLIFQLLKRHKVLSPQGQIVEIAALDNIFQEVCDAIPEASPSYQFFNREYFNAVCQTRLQQAETAIPWQGMILDEGHEITNPNTRRSKHLLQTSKLLARRGAFRLILSGTPFENKIQDLWVIAEFLNPGSMLKRAQFNTTFKELMNTIVAKLVEQSRQFTNGTLSRDNYQGLQEDLEKAFQQLNYLAQAIGQYTIRRCKTDFTGTAASSAQQKSLPNKDHHEYTWHMSASQQRLLAQEDERALLSACRGHHFVDIDADSDSENATNDGLSGIQLLSRLGKFLDHPVLVEERHHQALYERNHLEQMAAYVRDVIINQQYRGDLDAFVNDSGKLSLFVAHALEILNHPNHKILVPTTSIPMSVIIKVVLELKTKQVLNIELKPEIYSGKLSKELRKPLQDRFNNGVTRVAILSQQAGAFGIELFASHVLPYNENYNPFILLQAIDRAVRYGSPYETVVICNYVCNNPYSQKMSHIANEKLNWSQLFVDHSNECHIQWFVQRLQSIHLTTFCRTDSERMQMQTFVTQLISYIQNPASFMNPQNTSSATLFASPSRPAKVAKLEQPQVESEHAAAAGPQDLAYKRLRRAPTLEIGFEQPAERAAPPLNISGTFDIDAFLTTAAEADAQTSAQSHLFDSFGEFGSFGVAAFDDPFADLMPTPQQQIGTLDDDLFDFDEQSSWFRTSNHW